MDEEDWKEFAAILDRAAIARSYICFEVHMWDSANDLARALDELIWRALNGKSEVEDPA